MLYQEDKPSSIGIRALAARMYAGSHSAHNELARGYLFAGDTARALEEEMGVLQVAAQPSIQTFDYVHRIARSRQERNGRLARRHDQTGRDALARDICDREADAARMES